MAGATPRRSSLFSGLILVLFGLLFLLHNYRGGFPIGRILTHWWPVLLILWGIVKLYERLSAQRSGAQPGAPIRAGELFLILALLSLVGLVALGEHLRQHFPGIKIDQPVFGNSYSFDVDIPSKTVPANARILIRNGRGDISVRADETSDIRVSGKKTVRAWNEGEAEHLAEPVRLEIAQNGDAYEVRVPGYESLRSRVTLDLDVVVPRKAGLTVRNEKGDIQVSDVAGQVAVSSQSGDVEVRGAGAGVDIEMRNGDVKVADTRGDVKISGNGTQVEVINATGGLTLDGEFYGPIRAEKVAKGVRFISPRRDLTLTQLSGHLETGSGNLEIFDSTGNLTLRARSFDINLENTTGKIKIDNRDGNVQVRFSSPPKEDVEITDSSASITVILPSSSSFAIVADSHSGEIESEFGADSLKKTASESGDSHLEGKIGSRGPKITLKTSYGTISLRKTG